MYSLKPSTVYGCGMVNLSFECNSGWVCRTLLGIDLKIFNNKQLGQLEQPNEKKRKL
jgi:hypothetical protein